MNPHKQSAIILALLLPLGALAQTAEQSQQEADTPYTLSAPAGWQTERFALPPDFAVGFSYAGTEDIRFTPGWGDVKSEEHWSYSYLWWLTGTPSIDASTLTSNLQAYYSGLVGRNIANVPKEKIVPTTVTVKKAKTAAGDLETYTATINMLDYHEQKPIALTGMIHLKKIATKDHTAVFIEISPKPQSHAVWKKMDEIGENFSVK
jgi:hypothetical protein